MFGGGRWLNTYEIPFYGTEYLEGKYSENWQVGNDGSKDGLFTTIFGADLPANPKFKITMGASRRPQISTSFYLINSNSEWMRRNFEFIQAIFAGTTWLHLKYCILRPPNVYNVVCPGRFHMMYAAMDATITYEGKLRKNPKFSGNLRSLGIKNVDEDTLWPDAWKIALTIHDMTPNNFNMYANYYMNGFDINEMATLAQKQDLITAISDFGKYLKNLAEDYIVNGNAIEDAGKLFESAKESLKGVGDKIADGMKNAESYGKDLWGKRQEAQQNKSPDRNSADTNAPQYNPESNGLNVTPARAAATRQ